MLSKAVAVLGSAVPDDERSPFAEQIGLYSDFPKAFAELRAAEASAFAFPSNRMVDSFVVWSPAAAPGAVDPDGSFTAFSYALQESFGGEVAGAMRNEYANRLVAVLTDYEFPVVAGDGEAISSNAVSITGMISCHPVFETPFDPADSAEAPFGPSGAKVRYIRGTRDAARSDGGGFSSVALPLAGGLDLWLVVPEEGSGKTIDDFALLDFESVCSGLRKSLRKRSSVSDDTVSSGNNRAVRSVSVSFPAFETESRFDFGAFLEKTGLARDSYPGMGGVSGFGFSNMTAKFALDEGAPPAVGLLPAEAAREEDGAPRYGAKPPDATPPARGRENPGNGARAVRKPAQPEEFRCDRPFLFFVWRDDPGIVLFAGRFAVPAAAAGAP